jgi:hypothetical protein
MLYYYNPVFLNTSIRSRMSPRQNVNHGRINIVTRDRIRIFQSDHRAWGPATISMFKNILF